MDAKFREAAMGPNGWLNANLRTTFAKIIKRPGLEPWPRIFHNLRAIRETELVEEFPVQVVTNWLGNTPAIAMRHYLMTADAHFDNALGGTDEAAQKAAQQVRAEGSKASQVTGAPNAKPPVLPGVASGCNCVQEYRVAGTGFEPATSRL